MYSSGDNFNAGSLLFGGRIRENPIATAVNKAGKIRAQIITRQSNMQWIARFFIRARNLLKSDPVKFSPVSTKTSSSFSIGKSSTIY